MRDRAGAGAGWDPSSFLLPCAALVAVEGDLAGWPTPPSSRSSHVVLVFTCASPPAAVRTSDKHGDEMTKHVGSEFPRQIVARG